MANDQGISRRDWFRLRKPQIDTPVEQPRDGRIIGNEPSGLEPIPHPVNHDGMDLNSLPPMREALLAKSEVQQLFSDIESLATNILLMQRSAVAQRATAPRTATKQQLAVTQDLLLSGGIPRVQIRYDWQNTHWIDTLENRGDNVRLVRIAHVAARPGSQSSAP